MPMTDLNATPGLAGPGLSQPGNPGTGSAPPPPTAVQLGYARAGDPATSPPAGYGTAQAGTWP
jgi:hypothetical protein